MLRHFRIITAEITYLYDFDCVTIRAKKFEGLWAKNTDLGNKPPKAIKTELEGWAVSVKVRIDGRGDFGWPASRKMGVKTQ